MKHPGRYKKYGNIKYVTVIAVIIIIIAAGVLSSYVCLHNAKNKNHLSVDAMYLVKNGESDDKINVSATLYLTNVGAKSGDIKIVTYIMERWKGIAIDKKEINVGKLEKDKTSEVELNMQIGNGSYDIEVLVFEDDLLKIKGQGGITTTMVYDANEGIHRGDISWDSPPSFYDVSHT